MLEQNNILSDLHIHTIGSVHGFSTLRECISSAADAGMKYIAITDHYYNDGTELNRNNEVNRLKFLEQEASITTSGVRVIGGAEFNIGQEVSDWPTLKKLKWKLTGLHDWFLNLASIDFDQLLQYYSSAAEEFDAFSHIERGLHKTGGPHPESPLSGDIMDFLANIVHLSKKYGTFLEVNESSLRSKKPGNYERMRFWIRLAMENGNLISLGSDSHYCESIGRFDCAVELLNQIGFPKDRILNCNQDMLEDRFNRPSGAEMSPLA